MEALKKIYQKFRKLLDFRTLIPRIKNKLLKYQYYSMYRKEKVKPNTVFYQAYRPKIMSGNPYAIFKEMIEDPKYDNYIHYWAYGEDVVLESETCKRYRNHPRVKFIKGNTKEYMRALATCEYLVNNAALPSYWIKRPEQIYLNTWHGTPLKTLGRDAKDRSDASISQCPAKFLHV